jgi:hypothetical protein
MPLDHTSVVQALLHPPLQVMTAVEHHAADAIRLGRQDDADVVFVVGYEGDVLIAFLMAGQSAMTGNNAVAYLREYVGGDQGEVDELLINMARKLTPGVTTSNARIMPMRSTGTTWRAFRRTPPATSLELLSSARTAKQMKN